MRTLACPNGAMGAADIKVGQAWRRVRDNGIQDVAVLRLDGIGNAEINGEPYVVSVGDLLAYWDCVA